MYIHTCERARVHIREKVCGWYIYQSYSANVKIYAIRARALVPLYIFRYMQARVFIRKRTLRACVVKVRYERGSFVKEKKNINLRK